jgi:hypothetical protein
LLRHALRQQFVTSIVVYAACGLIFLAGIGLYAYRSSRPTPLSLSSITAESTDPAAERLPVDLDSPQVRWSSQGDPEDIEVALEQMDTQRRTGAKTVHSTEGQVIFQPDEYNGTLKDRDHGGQNRFRVVIQTAKQAFLSPEFNMRVGTPILAARIEPFEGQNSRNDRQTE